MYEIAKILSILETNENKNKNFDKQLVMRAQKTSNKLIKIGVWIILISLSLPFFGKLLSLPEFFSVAGSLIYSLGILVFVTAVSSEAILEFWWLFTKRKKDSKSMFSQVLFNMRLARKLSRFSNESLEMTKFHFLGVIERSERRIKLFFGQNSTLVALGGLAYTLLAHFNFLNWLPSMFTHFVGISDLWKFGVAIFLALFFGVLLGTFVLKGAISRYRNKIFILEFCLKLRELKIRA